jgi:hypothetical protein
MRINLKTSCYRPQRDRSRRPAYATVAPHPPAPIRWRKSSTLQRQRLWRALELGRASAAISDRSGLIAGARSRGIGPSQIELS